jgi:predicted Zn-dependent protease
MEDELTPGQVRAVIEHERAHLVGGHAWITQVARLNAACLPRLQGAREFQSAVRLLVELIADDAAARVCGRAEVAGALAALGSVRQDEGLMLRSRRVAARTGGGGLRRRIRGLGSASHPVPWAR